MERLDGLKMLVRNSAILVVAASAAAMAGLVIADSTAGVPSDLLAGGQAVRPTTMPPTSQPEGTLRAAKPAGEPAGPATQPDFQRGSQISFLLTRNLPDHLRVKQHLMFQTASAEQQRVWRGDFRSILQDANIRLEEFVARKNQFDRLSPAERERYRQKAELIEQMLKNLTPSEQAQLLSLDPKERARRIMELAAELKARQTRQPTPNK